MLFGCGVGRRRVKKVRRMFRHFSFWRAYRVEMQADQIHLPFCVGKRDYFSLQVLQGACVAEETVQQHVEEPITVYGDNEGSLEAAKSARISDKTKHIAVAELFVRQAVAEGWVVLVHVPGTENPADIFTKPLGPILFLRCALILMCTALRKQ